MKRFLLILYLLICSLKLTLYCQDSIKYTELGFLLYNEIPYINFLPVQNMSLTNPLNSFLDQKFDVGFQFNGYPKEIDFSKERIFNRIQKDSNLPIQFFYTKLIPVEITYIIYDIRTQEVYQKIYCFKEDLIINDKRVKIRYKIDYRKEVSLIGIKYISW